jgi:hypothetical protein
MLNDRYVFSELMDFVPKHDFDRCVTRYQGNRRIRNFSCYDQFLCMAFAQLTYRESLRDIETCLRALHKKLYHAGFRGVIARSTLADANEHRDWRIYADFAHVLIDHARRLYQADGFGAQLEQTAYALDSTTIDLCLTLFPWARFRRRKGAVKLHTLIDLRGNIPSFMWITHGKTHDVKVLDTLPIEAGAFYVMDRGYVDFGRLHRFTLGLAFFVTRAKTNLNFSRRSSRRVDKTTGLRSDQTIVLKGPKTSTLYPGPLRRVSYRRDGEGVRLSDQQLRPARIDDRTTLQVLLASGAFLSMDQATSENQIVLWDISKRTEDASMDCDFHLCAGGYHSERIEDGAPAGRNPANSERVAFRENPHF